MLVAEEHAGILGSLTGIHNSPNRELPVAKSEEIDENWSDILCLGVLRLRGDAKA
jgi:hypothetical protein